MLAGGADAFLQGELEFLVGEFRRQSNQSSSCKRISETSEIATRERSPSQLQLGGAVQEVLDLMSATTATSTCAASQPPSAATPPHQTPASPCFTSQTSLPCRLSAPSCLLLPDDIVLSILRLLDGPNLLLSASLVCRQWRLLVVRFQVSLFSNLCKQEFNIIIDLGDNNGTPTRSPLLIYQTHFNLKHASALRFYSDTVFHLAQDLLSPSLSHSESSTDKVEELHRNDPCAEDIDKASHTTFSNSFHSHFGHIMGTRVTKNNSSASLPPNFLFAWANNPDRAYTLSLAGTSKICWIDHSSLRDILVKDLMDPDISSILFNNNKCSNDHSPPSSHSSTTTSIPFTAAQPIVLTPTHKLSFHRAPIGLILSNNAGLLVSFDDANQIAVWDVSSSSSMSLHCSIDVNRQLRESAFMFHLEQRRLQQNQPHVPGATDPGVDIYHQQDVNEGGHRDDFDEEDGIEDGLGGGLVGLMQNIDLEGGIVSMNVHKRRIVTVKTV